MDARTGSVRNGGMDREIVEGNMHAKWIRIAVAAALASGAALAANAEDRVYRFDSADAHLVARAADRAANDQSRAIMGSLHSGEAPLRITQVPYIAGLHAAVLDPIWNGTPRPKTLTECEVCHSDIKSGDYKTKIFHVNDELFRDK